MTDQRRTPIIIALIAIGAIGLVFAVMAGSNMLLGSSPEEPIAAVLDLSTPCVNPTMELDGTRWETNDIVPGRWRELKSVDGKIQMLDSERAVFTANDGTTLRYQAAPGFSSHPCKLA